MPNFCDNVLYLKHKDYSQLERARKAAKEGELLEEFVPMPLNLKMGDDWYNWAVKYWGTKWDISLTDVHYHSEAAELVLFFETAWSPPIEWYRKMEELGFELTAYYNEFGMAFCGSYENGCHDTYDYPDEDISGIPEEIVKAFDLDLWV